MSRNIKSNILGTLAFFFTISASLSACDGNDQEEPSGGSCTYDLSGKLYARVAQGQDKTIHQSDKTLDDITWTLFTEDDIEWFDLNTREIRFKSGSVGDVLHQKFYSTYNYIAFHLGDIVLFDNIRLVTLADSRVYTDLVLCYGSLDTSDSQGNPVWGYYLYDCYPLQYSGDSEVQTNKEQKAGQWRLFINHLESKGKLRE